MIYICNKLHENIFNGSIVLERTRFSYIKISKGHNSPKNISGVTLLVLCTLSDGGSYLNKVL